jgi:acyl-CoA thioesterase I
MAALRICFVGDSITNGTGDEACLGWAGRVCVAARKAGHDVTYYNLGIRGDTSRLIAKRWRSECAARLPADYQCALVFAVGVNDAAHRSDEGLRVPIPESVAILRQMLGEAAAWLPTLFIGPAPCEESFFPSTTPTGLVTDLKNQRIAALSDAYARFAPEIPVPYLDVFAPLSRSPAYRQALRDGDGVHPTGAGYAAIADLVEAWPAWRAWLG